MAVRVRLTRVGSKKNAIWRVVVADQRAPRDGRSIETIGHYNPQTQPSTIVLDRERLDHWLERGAVPSNTVRKLMRAPAATEAEAPPAEPESPAQPDAPAEPQDPTEPEAPAEPEAPVEPEAPAEPQAAADPPPDSDQA
jgi:small subunit ribosomal protein S16